MTAEPLSPIRRAHTILGVCEALGDDFGFNPLYLRIAFAAGLWAFGAWFFGAGLVPGWTSVVLPMYFLGGIQLLSIGILGEYLGKSYFETKRRPRYIVEKTVSHDSLAGHPPLAVLAG